MIRPADHVGTLPPPTTIQIPGRGPTTVWDSGPRPGAPTLVLLHGWNVDSGLNFGNAFGVLSEEFRVIATDLHGHGGGHRCEKPFTIIDCAADVVALADVLGIDTFIPIGYSLGGAVAQVVADQVPERVDGMVLMATSSSFRQTRIERVQFAALHVVARLARRIVAVTPSRVQRGIFRTIVNQACRRYPDWVNDVVLAADMVRLLEAGAELGRFDSTGWLPHVRIPTVIVATTADRVVDPARQRHLGQLIEGAALIEIDADHRLPLELGRAYGQVLVDAARTVAGARTAPSVH